MTNSLSNRLFTKQRLYSYKFLEEKEISELLDEFSKAVDDLENIDVSLDDEDKAIILVNVQRGMENTITLEEVQRALR